MVSAYIHARPALLAVLSLAAMAACGPARSQSPPEEDPQQAPALEVIANPAQPRPPFEFNSADSAFLDLVQRGAFRYLWDTADPVTGMVFDRTNARVISVAGVGFQLSAIPIGVERAWITREQGQERTLRILSSLQGEPTNRKAGMFFHYLIEGSARPVTSRYETVASTIDSALLLAGMITASSYFGGEAARRADAMIADVDWTFYVARAPKESWAHGLVTLGWRPADTSDPCGEGSLLPYYWADAGDEQRLVTFLAVSAPDPSKRVPPRTYYRLRRPLGRYGDSCPFVWFPWSGAFFTHVFAHCWIDYHAHNPDDPAAFGIVNRPRVDWWENSRRAALMHRRKAVENPLGLPGFGPDAWGIGASDAPRGYQVAHLFPDPIPWPGAREGTDDPKFPVKDDWGDGTIAPYNAGSAIMFEPALALAAMRNYAALRTADGRPMVWEDPAAGGIGFRDSYHPASGWVAPDCVAIDQGPLILAIENARTGLIWRLFNDHKVVRNGKTELGVR